MYLRSVLTTIIRCIYNTQILILIIVFQIYKTLAPVLTVVLTDPSGPLSGRQEVALTLSMIAFLACHDLADVTATMNTLHSVFAASLPKVTHHCPVL